MNIGEKLAILASGGKFDVCSSTCSRPTHGSSSMPGVCHSYTPDGRCVSLFRVLLTNKCSGDCGYCPNSCDRKSTRAELGVEEYASLFRHFYERNLVEGLFLSSGVLGDEDKTMDKMIDIVESLRKIHSFGGYVHLKVIPGASRESIVRAARAADRLSINIEAPNASRFTELTSTKDYKIDILRRMEWLEEIERRKQGIPAGVTTQFVVGASGETDKEILACMEGVYRRYALRRCHFSAFISLRGTALEKREKTPLAREHRLYQADFLMRQYRFTLDEIVCNDTGYLSLRHDPKYLFALRNEDLFPIDINRASFEELVRVPGIGPRSARRILATRKAGHRFRKMSELSRLGIVMKRAQGFFKIGNVFQERLMHG